jgi:hypothetical protein
MELAYVQVSLLVDHQPGTRPLAAASRNLVTVRV